MLSAELFKYWTYQVFAPGTLLRKKYNAFKELLAFDDACLDLVADIEEIAYGEIRADWAHVVRLILELEVNVRGLAGRLKAMSPGTYPDIMEYVDKVSFYVRMALDMAEPDISQPHIISLAEASDLPHLAGGKATNVSLMAAETYLDVPDGFVVTASAFNYLLEVNELRPEIDLILAEITLEDQARLQKRCRELQQLITHCEVPSAMLEEMTERAHELAGSGTLAVRSSAIAEDGDLSFAGQYDSLLCVSPENIASAYLEVLASKYTPSALAYRIMNGLADVETSMAVLVMPLVEARAAGVIYTLDMDRSQSVDGVLSVYAVEGVGEALVSGKSRAQTWSFTREEDPLAMQEPDSDVAILSNDEALKLAKAGLELEQMFGGPQDVEWALDKNGRMVMLQSRPLQREQSTPKPRKAAPAGTPCWKTPAEPPPASVPDR